MGRRIAFLAATAVTVGLCGCQAVTEPAATPAAVVAGGCVAGSPVSAARVLELHTNAPATTAGAVEFAGAFSQLLLDTAPEIADGAAEVIGEVTADPFRSDALKMIDPQASLVPPPPREYTLKDGRFRVEDATDDRVVVAVAGSWHVASVTTGAETRAGGTLVLERVDDSWVITDTAEIDVDDVYETGTPFQDGC